jgi:hypothetical protein
MMAQWYGRRAPQSVVTSWTHLPFFELDVKGTKPRFFNGELDMWDFIKKFGVAMDDCSIMWKADPGEVYPREAASRCVAEDGGDAGSDGGVVSGLSPDASISFTR